ncbi:sensor histidine kinase [Actinotalea sp. K2]|uniref:sensor histidine kinase n=1 Tax=Actinotalea sp. K2 TaxID=2939438 RepID=UPI002017DADE|nr:sensor histidine kinase [Actinotalea sp. K2]MCL3860052.1 sensor histidine kinase [Actinotalea sp. K2]
MTTAENQTAETHPAGGVLSERAAFWARALRWWDIAFYVMVLIAVGALATGSSTGDLRVELGGLAALVVAYTLVGRRAARTASTTLAVLYLVILVVAVTVIVRANPAGTVMLFIAFSQIWFFAETRRLGVLACTALTVGVFGALALREEVLTTSVVADLATQAGMVLAFGVLLGLWVTQMAEQSEERADLLERLEAAQAELGRSHHAEGVAAERERLAREIHDTLAQGFTSIVMLAQTADADLHRGDAEHARERVELIEATARDNLAEARALVAAFSPVSLQGSTLVEAIERLAERFGAETGVEVEVAQVADGAAVAALSRAQEVILLRAAQEALSNVRRHADARHVRLVLRANLGLPDDGTAGTVGTAAEASRPTVELEVVDDGRGIPDGTSEGFGMRGMRERVTSGGGRLAVSAGLRGGTHVRVTLPTAREPATPTPRTVGPEPATQTDTDPERP